MRITIVGAGALGTLLGHGFASGGHFVTAVDLPKRIDQLRETGAFALIAPDGTESAAKLSLATTRFSDVVPQDLIILATKSQDLPTVAQGVSSIAGNDTPVVTVQNGIPWWYLQGLDKTAKTTRIPCLDPDGLLERYIDRSSIIGCVAYPAAAMTTGGRALHVEGNRFPIGELDGSISRRTKAVSAAFEDAGFKSRIISDIRSEIWLKAWGALSINPISALTRATMADICRFDETRELIAEMMREAQGVAESLGASFRHTIDRRIEGAEAVGDHKTSMLQDVESGRQLELDALLLAVIQLAELTGTSVPTIHNIYACTALLDATLQAEKDAAHIE